MTHNVESSSADPQIATTPQVASKASMPSKAAAHNSEGEAGELESCSGGPNSRQMRADSDTTIPPVEELEAAIRNLKPNLRRQKELVFAKLYPVIAEEMAGGVPLKTILKALKKKGYTLSPMTYNKFAKAQMKSAQTDLGGGKDE